MDFPAELGTSSCILGGSSDVAYAICVPAKAGNSGASDAATAELESPQSKGIERLRNAENELRKARILVSVDQTKGELITFYRKEDLQREAKSIFHCVMTILRKNECQMSFKSAIKTADLLRPDRVGLHHLFVSAILCMIKSVVKQEENLIALDLNTFLLRAHLSPQKPDESIYEAGDSWSLLKLNAQLLTNGKILAINSQHTLTTFKCVSSLSHKEGSAPFLRKPSKVLLALTGQYARYMGGYVGRLPRAFESAAGPNASDRAREAATQIFRQQIWKDLVEHWLAENEPGRSVEEGKWIEVELPFCEADSEHPRSPEGFTQRGNTIWKPIFWPASLCYVDTMDQPSREEDEASLSCFEDPLQFVEDWILSVDDREAAIRKLGHDVEVPMKPDGVGDQDTTHNGGIHVDAGQSFRRITYLDGQAVATIYPTPPGGALSQVTPGISYADGIGATPGEGAILGQADRLMNSIEMTDLVPGQAAIGTGFYDEDLFEDVPGEKFGETEMADVPNLDFFDQADADMIDTADDMEVDIPGKVAVTDTYMQSLSHKIGAVTKESINVFAEESNDTGTSELKNIHGSEFKGVTEEGRPHFLEKHSKDEMTSEIWLAGPIIQPLDPIEVRKKLFPNTGDQNTHQVLNTDNVQPNRRTLVDSYFDSNSAQPELRLANSRYGANGPFWFEPEERGKAFAVKLTEQYLGIPRVGIPNKKRSVPVLECPGGSGSLRSSSSTQDSEFDSSDFLSQGNKRESGDRSDADELASSIVLPVAADDVLDSETESKCRMEAMEILELLRPEINEQSFGRTYQPSQRGSNLLPVGCDNLLTVAQVMVDQVSQSFFSHDRFDDFSFGTGTHKPGIFHQLESAYGDAAEVDLAKLAELSLSTQDAAEGSGLAESPSPLIRLARGDVNVTALPTIQPFWETLGLQPVSGQKNITAFCIHPAGAHIGEGSSAFLQRLSELYSNCNLGSHATGILQDLASDGLIEWGVGKESRIHELLRICERIGSSLSILPSSAENVMIYIVNPFTDGYALADICSAFVALFTNYAKSCGKSNGSELNLQVIPMSFIASADTVVIPCQAEYLSLALEVYNRCPLTNSSGAVALSGAAVTLAEPVPKDIVFYLTSDATSPLSRDGEILHLAYSQSMDHRWMIACWSDDLGNTALTMTYCLRQKGSTTSRPRSEVIKEMWEVSEDIMTKTRAKWRLSVAHDGPIEPEEINEWSFLANQNASHGTVSQCVLVLLTFDEHPSIQFFPPPPPQSRSQPPAAAAGAAATTTGKYGTPASTPSAAAMTSSPDQITAFTAIPPTPGASGGLAAPTPPDQSSQSQAHTFDVTTDPDVTLVEPTDEFWSLILSFGLNNSNSPLDSRPALLSGFLLKRRGPLDSDGVVALGVNLIYTSADMTPTERKALLRGIIGQWRGLYTLARTKNLVGPTSVLPWHIHTAIKGCRAVSQVL